MIQNQGTDNLLLQYSRHLLHPPTLCPTLLCTSSGDAYDFKGRAIRHKHRTRQYSLPIANHLQYIVAWQFRSLPTPERCLALKTHLQIAYILQDVGHSIAVIAYPHSLRLCISHRRKPGTGSGRATPNHTRADNMGSHKDKRFGQKRHTQ